MFSKGALVVLVMFNSLSGRYREVCLSISLFLSQTVGLIWMSYSLGLTPRPLPSAQRQAGFLGIDETRPCEGSAHRGQAAGVCSAATVAQGDGGPSGSTCRGRAEGLAVLTDTHSWQA